jgi:hypothetical protein
MMEKITKILSKYLWQFQTDPQLEVELVHVTISQFRDYSASSEKQINHVEIH